MTAYEYKVIPAPAKGVKARGVKGPEARFAFGLQSALNAEAGDGWEYVRAEILPSTERQGLTSSQTIYRTVLVFRRPTYPAGAGPAPDAATEGDTRAEPPLTAAATAAAVAAAEMALERAADAAAAAAGTEGAPGETPLESAAEDRTMDDTGTAADDAPDPARDDEDPRPA